MPGHSSLTKDIASNDQRNLVIAIRHARGCSFQEALDTASLDIRKEVGQLQAEERRYAFVVGPDLAELVRSSCSMIHNQLGGTVEWLWENVRHREVEPSEFGVVAPYHGPLPAPGRPRERERRGKALSA